MNLPNGAGSSAQFSLHLPNGVGSSAALSLLISYGVGSISGFLTHWWLPHLVLLLLAVYASAGRCIALGAVRPTVSAWSVRQPLPGSDCTALDRWRFLCDTPTPSFEFGLRLGIRNTRTPTIITFQVFATT